MNSLGFVFTFLALAALCQAANNENTKEMEQEEVKVDGEKLEYAKGSACGYCSYCKFCKLCDEDCPCEKSATKPNCHMCKYCKFCYLCKGVCNTVCQPGGIIDKVSAAIVNALPSYNKDEVESDIAGVSSWLNQNRDEL